MLYRLRLSLLILLLLAGLPLATQAQDNDPAVQEFTGTIENDILIYYDLPDMEEGQTLYAFLETTDGTLDTVMGLRDMESGRIIAFDDDSGTETDSQFSFTFETSGNYQLIVSSYDKTTAGDYRLLVSLDEPAVLEGVITPQGDPFMAFLEDNRASRTIDTASGEVDCSVLEDRPQLTGEVRTRETDQYVIHFTMEGRDGATPSFIEQVVKAIEDSWTYQVEEMGWAVPPPDCGEGGDSRFDIYVQELVSNGILGMATPQKLVGDNPNTETIETYAAYSYLTIDNNFARTSNPLVVMRSTVAHEIAHNIQFGYDINESYFGIYESTAVWMELRTFPESGVGMIYNRDYLNTPDRCIGAENVPDVRARIYGEWFMLDSIAQDAGDESIIHIWERLAEGEGLQGFYDALDDLDISPQDMVRRLAIRTLLHDFPEVASFNDRVRVESNINGPGEIVPRKDGVEQLAVDYVRVERKDVYHVSIDDPVLNMVFVGVDTIQNEASIFDIGQAGVIDTRPYQHGYFLILNQDIHEAPKHCVQTDWVLTVESRDEAEARQSPDETWAAPDFIPAG